MKASSRKKKGMSYDEFCQALDVQEQENPLVCYSNEERKFLWDEIAQKTVDIQTAIFEWVKTGKETELVIPELKIPDDFWDRPLKNVLNTEEVQMKPISAKSLMASHDMNYIVAAFTIDWIRREPEEAIMTLRRGMS